MPSEKASKDAIARKRVEFLPGIPTGEVSPEERRALKENNPQAFADLTRYEKAQEEKAAAAPAEAQPEKSEAQPITNNKNGGAK